MTDHLAIADAIAAKGAAITGVRGGTARVPDALTITPYFVVFPPDATLTEYTTQDLITSVFPAMLYLAQPADTGRTLAAVYPFIDRFYIAWRTGRLLGIATVQESYILDHEIDDLPDYDGQFLGIRWRIGVRSRENIQRSAV